MAILHTHLLLALVFIIGLWRATGVWLKASAVAGLLLALTGAHNFMTRMEGAPTGWHAVVGIKILLGLHAITMVLLMARGGVDPAKFARWRRSAAISATVVIAIGLYYSNWAGR